VWAKLEILSSGFVTTKDLTCNWKVHRVLESAESVYCVRIFLYLLLFI